MRRRLKKKEKTPCGVKLSLADLHKATGFFNEVTGPETSASADSATGADMKKRVVDGRFKELSRREELLEFTPALAKTHGRTPSTGIYYTTLFALCQIKS